MLDEPRHVCVGRVMGHAAHWDWIAATILGAGGQRQFKDASRRDRILVEHLVEVSHTEEYNRVAVLMLGIEVLPHGRCGRYVGGGCHLWRVRHYARW